MFDVLHFHDEDQASPIEEEGHTQGEDTEDEAKCSVDPKTATGIFFIKVKPYKSKEEAD